MCVGAPASASAFRSRALSTFSYEKLFSFLHPTGGSMGIL